MMAELPMPAVTHADTTEAGVSTVAAATEAASAVLTRSSGVAVGAPGDTGLDLMPEQQHHQQPHQLEHLHQQPANQQPEQQPQQPELPELHQQHAEEQRSSPLRQSEQHPPQQQHSHVPGTSAPAHIASPSPGHPPLTNPAQTPPPTGETPSHTRIASPPSTSRPPPSLRPPSASRLDAEAGPTGLRARAGCLGSSLAAVHEAGSSCGEESLPTWGLQLSCGDGEGGRVAEPREPEGRDDMGVGEAKERLRAMHQGGPGRGGGRGQGGGGVQSDCVIGATLTLPSGCAVGFGYKGVHRSVCGRVWHVFGQSEGAAQPFRQHSIEHTPTSERMPENKSRLNLLSWLGADLALMCLVSRVMPNVEGVLGV